MMRLCLLLLSACQDYRLGIDDGSKPGFDSGGDSTPTVDTGDSDSSVDDTGTIPAECTDRSFAGAAVPTVDCAPGATTPSWELVEKWSSAAPSGDYLSAPSIAQLTDDNGNGRIDDGDTPDVVVASFQLALRAYSGADGTELWSLATPSAEQTTPAIADLDGDGFPEVVVGGLSATIALHGEDGSSFWTGPGRPGDLKPYCGGIGIADLEADGEPEVYFGATILDGLSGVTKAAGSEGSGTGVRGESPMSIAADMDRDGFQEVIVGNAAYDYEGNTLWSNGGDDGYPAVGNFDSDTQGELVIANTVAVRLLDDDGSEIWSFTPDDVRFNGPPILADVDGDGATEIVIPANSGIYVLEADGALKWQHEGSATDFYNGASAYDLDGNGAWEILYHGPHEFFIFDGETGAVVASYLTENAYSCLPPVVADVDRDGHVDIAMNTVGEVLKAFTGILVLDDGANEFVPGRPIWNQHDFALTNVNDDGTVPPVPDTNWLEYNSFRAGPPVDAVGPPTNLLPVINDVCSDTCDQGRVTVWYSVVNDGVESLTQDLALDLYGTSDSGEVLLWTGTWTADVPSGWHSDAESIELTGVPVPLYDLRLVLDHGDPKTDDFAECDETDNTSRWGRVVCN